MRFSVKLSLMFCLLLTFVPISVLASENGNTSSENISAQKVINVIETDDSIIEYYELEKDLKKLEEKAKFNSVIDGIEIISELNGKKQNVKSIVEKVKKVTNKKTKEVATTFQATIITPIKLEQPKTSAIAALGFPNIFTRVAADTDIQDEWDTTYSVFGYARATYTSVFTGDFTYTRVSKWEAKYDRIDSTVTLNDPIAFAWGWGETYDGDYINWCSGFYCGADFTSVPVKSENTWHSLYPYWSDEYIVEGELYGQEGGFHTTLQKGSSTWQHKAFIRYGMHQKPRDENL